MVVAVGMRMLRRRTGVGGRRRTVGIVSHVVIRIVVGMRGGRRGAAVVAAAIIHWMTAVEGRWRTVIGEWWRRTIGWRRSAVALRCRGLRWSRLLLLLLLLGWRRRLRFVIDGHDDDEC